MTVEALVGVGELNEDRNDSNRDEITTYFHLFQDADRSPWNFRSFGSLPSCRYVQMSADYDVIGSNLTGGNESTKSNERIRQIAVQDKILHFL